MDWLRTCADSRSRFLLLVLLALLFVAAGSTRPLLRIRTVRRGRRYGMCADEIPTNNAGDGTGYDLPPALRSEPGRGPCAGRTARPSATINTTTAVC